MKEKAILQVLSFLYDNFPKRILLSVDAFVDETATEEEKELYANCIRWLLEEGYIRGLPHSTYRIVKEAVLTTKGLALLEESRLWEKIKHALKEGSVFAIKTAFASFLQIAIKEVKS
ncbi:hypothetical protein [Hydrogenobacter thermophilus]|uniref:hypothetical protein n=1 Tax=Hydrogenobacter thermophilus TaxID=940 RepID=UPI0030FAAD8F